MKRALVAAASLAALCGCNTNVSHIHKHTYQIGLWNETAIHGSNLADVLKGNKQEAKPEVVITPTAAP